MIIKIRVKSGAWDSVVEEVEGIYRVSVKERAIDNKANVAVLKLLKKFFNADVRIISGRSSRNKIVEIEN